MKNQTWLENPWSLNGGLVRWENHLEMDINGGFSIAMFDYRGVFDE